MRVAVDISQAVYEGTGVGRFTSGLIDAICHHAQHTSEISWVFFYVSFRRDLSDEVKTVISRAQIPLIKLPVPPTAAEYIWNHLHIIPVSLLLPKCDWVITSDWTEPPSRTKKATIVHDLVFHRYPETVDTTIIQTMRRKLPLVSDESNLIFTDSQTTKDDLLQYYPNTKASIVVNYPGVSIDTVTDTTVISVVQKYTLSSPYLLTVGKREPRKNLNRLIDAFQQAQLGDTQLVIVGSEGWGSNTQQGSNVRFLGFVSDEELAALYQQAQGFILASLWEGFGYPILEAMQLGTPVATSDCSSMAEIADCHAHLFDPMNKESIASSLERLVSDDPYFSSKEKARQHALSFTWKRYLNTFTHSLSIA